MAWQSDTINPASTSPAGDITKITNDLQQLRSVIGGGTDAAIPSSWATEDELLGQSLISGTTGGTSTAYTLTPAKAITAYAANQSFWIKFHTASGASPTLQISGVATPPALVRYNGSGTLVAIAAGEIPANFTSRVTLLSTTQALVEEMPPGASTSDTLRIDIASASTVNLTTGAPNTRNINITGTTTITAFTVAAGLLYFVRFAGALTLTNGAGLVTQTGSNITTAAGDTCILRSTAANTVEVLAYTSPKVSSVSGEITITSNAIHTFTHGLGKIPTNVRLVTRCKTAELGYSVGDEIEFSTYYWTGNGSLNVASSSTATTVTLNGNLGAVHKTSATGIASMTHSNWRFVFYVSA